MSIKTAVVSVMLSLIAQSAFSQPICAGIWCDEGVYYPGTWTTTHYEFTQASTGDPYNYSTPVNMVAWLQWRNTSAPEAGQPADSSQHFFVRGEFPLGTTSPPTIPGITFRTNGVTYRTPATVVFPDIKNFPSPPEPPTFTIKNRVDGGGVRGKVQQDIDSKSSVTLVENSPDLFLQEITVPADAGLAFGLFKNLTQASAGDWLDLYFQGNLLSSVALAPMPAGQSFLIPIDFTGYAGQTGWFAALLDSDEIVGASVQFVPTFYEVSSESEISLIAEQFTSAVPEPSTLLMMFFGVLSIIYAARPKSQ